MCKNYCYDFGHPSSLTIVVLGVTKCVRIIARILVTPQAQALQAVLGVTKCARIIPRI
jgi:hypothetical protein